jgi:hypothetical protein
MNFLDFDEYSFIVERVKKNEKKEGTSRLKIFLRGLPNNEVVAYFDSRKDRFIRTNFTFRNLDSSPLLYMKAMHNIARKKRDIWTFYKLDEDLESDEELDENSPFFFGRTVHQSTLTKPRSTFVSYEDKQLFSIEANALGTKIVFFNLESEEPAVLAEGTRKVKTKWGWDYKFSLSIHPSCDKLRKALIIACMRVIAPLFYPR